MLGGSGYKYRGYLPIRPFLSVLTIRLYHPSLLSVPSDSMACGRKSPGPSNSTIRDRPPSSSPRLYATLMSGVACQVYTPYKVGDAQSGHTVRGAAELEWAREVCLRSCLE